MRTTLKAAAVLAVAVPVLALAACSGGSASSGPQGSQSASAPAAALNPVSILKKMGVPTQAVYGQVDVYGDRYASGDFPGGENVTVYTFASQSAQLADDARNNGGASTDSNVVIAGPGWKAIVAGVLDFSAGSSGAVRFEVSPAVLAHRAGGTVRSGRA